MIPLFVSLWTGISKHNDPIPEQISLSSLLQIFLLSSNTEIKASFNQFCRKKDVNRLVFPNTRKERRKKKIHSRSKGTGMAHELKEASTCFYRVLLIYVRKTRSRLDKEESPKAIRCRY